MNYVKNGIGKKWFRWKAPDDGTELKPDILRVTNIKDDHYVVKRDGEKASFPITEEELKDNYTPLKPSGLITANIVTVENEMKDVVFSLFRMSDSVAAPFVVCRQNCYDILSNMLKHKEDKRIYVGCSINRANCPKSIDFNTMTLCKTIEYGEAVYVYMDDNLDTILPLLKTNKYDDALIEIKDSIQNEYNFPGYCTNLRSLLEDNHFMTDFHSSFGIMEIKDTLEDGCFVMDQIATKLEDILKRKLKDITIVKFGYDINFRDIEKKYVIIADKYNRLYVVSYVDEGYSNPSYNSFDDKSEYDYLKQFIVK